MTTGVKLSFLIILLFLISACSKEKNTREVNKKPLREAVHSDTSSTAAPEALNEMRKETVYTLVKENENLTTLLRAVQQAERAVLLKAEGPVTVFAPVNAAFNALPEGRLDDLIKSKNKQQLMDILSYHIVRGAIELSSLDDGQTITTVLGKKLTVHKKNGEVTINGAQIIEADIKASNGLIHVIDTVLMP